jgi:glycosyltransferase involved in cell wall biosynthesis
VKILFIHNRYQEEGGEDVAFNAEVSLFKQDHEVFELVFNNDDIVTVTGKLKAAVTGFYNLSSARKVKEIIAVFEPDVIHIHNLFFTASPSILYAAKKKRVPVIITLHNYRLICCNALLLRNNKVCELCTNHKLPHYGIKYKCYRKSVIGSAITTGITGVHKYLKTWNKYVSQYISLTEFARYKFITSSLSLNDNQITVIPNFVFDNGEPRQTRENFFLYVGRISEEKGIELLLKTFSPGLIHKLIIVGDGPVKSRLEEQYASGNISFIGKKGKHEVLDLMKRCKALIFPSVCYEGMPFTIIEAFSTGTPVIASRLGAMAELIQDGMNGFHFETNNAQDLKNVIQKFTQLDEGKRKNMCDGARFSYEQKYHPEAHYKAILSVYQKAIQQYRK